MARTAYYGGLDIGSSSLKLAVGTFTLEEDKVHVLGCLEFKYKDIQPSLVVKGVINDPEALAQLINDIYLQAEEEFGVNISKLALGFSGLHITTQTGLQSDYPTSENGVVTGEDVERVLARCQVVACPDKKHFMHALTRRFFVNGMNEVVSLEGQSVHDFKIQSLLIFAAEHEVLKGCRLVSKFSQSTEHAVAYNGYAQALAALDADDKQRGSLLIDIGAALTEFTVYQGGQCLHAGVLPVGMQHVANDVSLGLDLPFEKAHEEMLKRGRAIAADSDVGATFNYDQSVDYIRCIPVESLEKIMEARLRELFEEIRRELVEAQVLNRVGCKIVLTGGGAGVKEIDRLAREVISEIRVELGSPKNAADIQDDRCKEARFVTAVGLLFYQREALLENPSGERMRFGKTVIDFFKGAWQAVFNW